MSLDPTERFSNGHSISNNLDANDASHKSVQHPVESNPSSIGSRLSTDSAPVEPIDAEVPPAAVVELVNTETHSQEQPTKRLKVNVMNDSVPWQEPIAQTRVASTTNDHHRTRLSNKSFDGSHTTRFQQRTRNPPNQSYVSSSAHHLRPNFHHLTNGNRGTPSTDWLSQPIRTFHNPTSTMDCSLPSLFALPDRK